jgi:hypothetical protein
MTKPRPRHPTCHRPPLLMGDAGAGEISASLPTPIAQLWEYLVRVGDATVPVDLIPHRPGRFLDVQFVRLLVQYLIVRESEL